MMMWHMFFVCVIWFNVLYVTLFYNSMACKKKTNLDRNRIIDAVPGILRDRIQSVFRMLENCENNNYKSVRNCKQLKTGLKTLLNFLYKVQTLVTSSDVKKYLANLSCLRAEFLAINSDTGWMCAEAIGILDELKALAGSRRDTTQSGHGVMQQKFFETSASNNEPFGFPYSPPLYSLTSIIADGYR